MGIFKHTTSLTAFLCALRQKEATVQSGAAISFIVLLERSKVFQEKVCEFSCGPRQRKHLKVVYNYLDCAIRFMVLGILYYQTGLLLAFCNVLLRNISSIQFFGGSQTRANLHRDGKHMQTAHRMSPSSDMNPEPSGCELTLCSTLCVPLGPSASSLTPAGFCDWPKLL